MKASMKFIYRSIIVFAVAIGIGMVLYFAVQALPNDSRPANPPANGAAHQNGLTSPGNQTSRPERPENNRNEGIRWRSLARIARRTFVFAVIVFITVLAKNSVFDRESRAKKSTVVQPFQNKKSHH